MLATDLPALEVEGIAVAVVGRHAENGDPAVVVDVAHLPVVWDVAEYEVATLGIPGRAFGPERPRPQTLNGSVRLGQAIERGVDRDDVRIPEIYVWRTVWAEIARRAGDSARRRDRSHLLRAQRGP